MELERIGGAFLALYFEHVKFVVPDDARHLNFP